MLCSTMASSRWGGLPGRRRLGAVGEHGVVAVQRANAVNVARLMWTLDSCIVPAQRASRGILQSCPLWWRWQ
jgi:hypothetical protein